MISPARIKFISSLQQKKYRKLYGSFVAEGEKIVTELLQGSFFVEGVFALPGWFDSLGFPVSPSVATEVVSPKELGRISGLSTPNKVLAVVRIPDEERIPAGFGSLALYLDGIQDPGNLGTILRTADWFGITHVFCSHGTADIYNPKVIQASMGSFIRVKTLYTGLPELLANLSIKPVVYGAALTGKNLFEEKASSPALLVIGNESKGISADLLSLVDKFLRIPGKAVHAAPAGHASEAIDPANPKPGAESLNASVAASIFMAWFHKHS